MAGGILDGLVVIQAIMKEQGCDWEAARQLWHISNAVEAERQTETAEAKSNVIQLFPAKH
jgi:hypothetical protein